MTYYEEAVQPKRQKEQQGSPAQDVFQEESARLKLKGEEPNTAGTEEEIVQPKRQKEQQGSPAQDDREGDGAQRKLKRGEPVTRAQGKEEAG